jgi:hypothetical protein
VQGYNGMATTSELATASSYTDMMSLVEEGGLLSVTGGLMTWMQMRGVSIQSGGEVMHTCSLLGLSVGGHHLDTWGTSHGFQTGAPNGSEWYYPFGTHAGISMSPNTSECSDPRGENLRIGPSY